MYYPPPLFTPVRPFESRPNPLEGTAATAGDVPSVVGTGTRENPLDLSVKNLRQGTEGTVVEGEDLLMLEHRKLASLAASHPLSALARPGLVPGSAAAALLDPTLYRLAYGPEALVPSPFCYDRATGVAVPTSLASHQLMSSILQQQQREQQQALLAARTSAAAQQAAVAAALMDPSSLPFGLRGAAAMTQREVAAALAATRGLYTPAIPTPVVLPGYPLYAADEKGAFTSLRNGVTDKAAYLNGAAATSTALEAARFAEHLQRLREQHIQQAAGKCANACCTGLPGLGGATAVPCACCIQSPSQSALCARSPLGSMKDPTTAATAAKVCGATSCGDYLQPGLTLLHRPSPVTTSELKLPVSSLCSTTTSTSSYSTSTETICVGSGFQPTTSWTGASLPGSSTSGKTAFTVPKKKDGTTQKDVIKPTVSHAKDGVKSEFHHHHHHDIHKRDHHLDKTTVTTTSCFTYNPPVSAATSIKREVNARGGDAEFVPRTDINTSALLPPHPKKEHDVKSILTPKTTAPAIVTPSAFPVHKYSTHGYVGTGAQTTVTAVTPIVPTKCEGGTIIPKTSVVPPTLQPFRAHDLQYAGRSVEPQRSLPSPIGPPPLIAVGKPGPPNNNSQKTAITASVTHATVTTVSTTTAATSIYGAGIVSKPDYSRNNSYQTTDALRHQALLHGAYHPGNFQKNVPLHTIGASDRFMAIDVSKNHKNNNNNKGSSVGSSNLATPLKANSVMPFIKEEPVSKPVPPVSIPKPIPQHPTATKHLGQTNMNASPHFTANPYMPYHLPNNNWMPPAHPNVTVAPPMQQVKNPISTASLHSMPPSTFATTIAGKVVKSESIPVIKKEPDYSSYTTSSTNNNNNVLQSLLVRPNKGSSNANSSTSIHQHHNAPTSTGPMPPVVTSIATTFVSTASSSSNCITTTVSPSAAAAAAAMLHNACSVIMPNPSTYPLLDYQYQNMIRGLNGLNLSRTATGPPPILCGGVNNNNTSGGINVGCPAIASTAPVLPKFEPKPECSIAGGHALPAVDCSSKASRKRPIGGIFNPICSTTSATSAAVTSAQATVSTSVGKVAPSADSGLVLGESSEKKRCVAVETNITTPASLHPFSLQCPPPTCNVPQPAFLPYPFVKEPQVPVSSDQQQQVLPIKSTRPVRSVSCSTDTPPELEVVKDNGAAVQPQSIAVLAPATTQENAAAKPTVTTEIVSPPTTSSSSLLADIQAKNVRRSACARASRRLRKRCLAHLVYRRRHQSTNGGVQQSEASSRVSHLYASWRYRRYLYGVLRNRGSIFAGDEPGTSADRKNRKCGAVYNVGHQSGFSDCAQKVSESCSALPIPAEMKKIMVNKALGETILHRAARLGYVEVVAYCLETNGSQINCQDNAGYTPLHECCSRGHLDIARALLKYGADVNASAAGGIRPIHDAVENDHVEVVRLLLSYGADPSISTYSGLTPLKLARSALMAEFLQGFIADVSGEMENRPYLPWKFWGSSACLDPDVNGYDVFDGVPSDGEQTPEGEEDDDFVFEVSDSPHLPTFRLALGNSKSYSNYLRLSDILRKVQITKDFFLERYGNIDIVTVPRHEFEAIATCSRLLTGTKLDNLLASRDFSGGMMMMMMDSGPTVELVRLDNGIRKILGIETISVR